MENHNHLVPTGDEGIVCDNPACDYRDPEGTLDKLEEYLNKPCPKCGENLLTEQDYNNALTVRNTIAFLNSLNEDELKELASSMIADAPDHLAHLFEEEPDKMFQMKINTHDTIKIELKPLDDDNTSEQPSDKE